MAFTADELQSLNDILDRKLTAHLHEVECAFDQRIQTLHRDIEHRLSTAQQEIIASTTQRMADQQGKMQTTLDQKLHSQQLDITQTVGNELRHRLQQLLPQFESIIERTLAAKIPALEELLSQRPMMPTLDNTEAEVLVGEQSPHFEAIEVQTDLPWEDLIDIFGKALDERLETLNRSTQESIRNWEQYLSSQLRNLRSEMQDEVVHIRQPQAYSGNLTSMQEVFQSIEQLERIIESLQVAMTTNHALLSNRLYHHQHLPLEKAHGSDQQSNTSGAPANGTSSSGPRPLTGERSGQSNNS